MTTLCQASIVATFRQGFLPSSNFSARPPPSAVPLERYMCGKTGACVSKKRFPRFANALKQPVQYKPPGPAVSPLEQLSITGLKII